MVSCLKVCKLMSLGPWSVKDSAKDSEPHLNSHSVSPETFFVLLFCIYHVSTHDGQLNAQCNSFGCSSFTYMHSPHFP